jgi:hypothetical protein
MIDEVEVGTGRRGHPDLVVGAGRHGRAHPFDDRVAVHVEQRQVQLQFARKVLIQHWL